MSFSIDNLIAAASPDSDENVNMIRMVGPALFQKYVKGLYFDTRDDKEIIFQHLENKIKEIDDIPDETYPTGRNLVYFSVFLSEKYLEMLDISLKSIARYAQSPSFDIMFITDEAFKTKILELESIKPFNVKFHIIDTPKNGIEASFTKLRIHEFSEVKNYEKILFLDTDVIALQDINQLFNKQLQKDKLHTKSNTKNKYAMSFTSATHGLMFLTQKQAEFIDKNTDIVPFNAGQFLFLNTAKMLDHFKNVRWLKSVWPGLYFFEQSFMNQYFAIYGFVEQKLLETNVEIIFTALQNKSPAQDPRRTKNIIVSGATNSIYNPTIILLDQVSNRYVDMIKQHTDNTILMHFAGFTLRGSQKIDYMKYYSDAYKLQI